MIVHNVKVGNRTSEHVSDRDHKKIYVGCAESDIRYRDMLVNGRHRWELYSKPTIDFITIDRKGIELIHHKTLVDKTIRSVDGVMIIVSQQTSKDPLASWEINRSLLYGISIVGVDVRPIPEGSIPKGLEGKIITFGWEWFADFFDTL